MVKMTRLAALVLRHRLRAGEGRLRRRLLAAGTSPAEVEAAFRYAAFLAARGGPAPPRLRLSRRLAAAGLAAWSALIASLAALRLWATSAPEAPPPMPDEVWVRETLAAYRPAPLARPAALDELLRSGRGPGNAGTEYLRAAALAASAGLEALRLPPAAGPAALAALERGVSRRSCAVAGVLRVPGTSDERARLELEEALVARLGAMLRRRAQARMRARRWDLAQEDALAELALGRHLLEEWLASSQAAALERIESGAEALAGCLAARGLLDPAARVRLGRLRLEARAYAADAGTLALVEELGGDPARLGELARFLDEAPLRRPYAEAALEAAASSWSPGEVDAGAPDPRRRLWLLRACGHPDARVAALARGALRRLGRAELACGGMSPERRRAACPRPAAL